VLEIERKRKGEKKMTNEEMRELCNMLKQLIEKSSEEEVRPIKKKRGKFRGGPCVHFTTYIPLEYKIKIEEIANKKGETQAEVIREAISKYYNIA